MEMKVSAMLKRQATDDIEVAAVVLSSSDPQLASIGKVDTEWNWGSCAKVLTATIAATLVRKGVLSYESTIGDILGTYYKGDSRVYTINLGELLTHSAGLPVTIPQNLLLDIEQKDFFSTPRKARLALVLAVLEGVGPRMSHIEITQTKYSNIGYLVAGILLEEAAGLDFEQLVQDHLALPLHMCLSGPHSQLLVATGRLRAKPSAIAAFAQTHLQFLLGKCSLLGSSKDMAHLHHLPPWTRRFTYGGWSLTHNPIVKQDRSLGRISSTHSGSSTLFHSRIVLLPDRDRAILVLANTGGRSGRLATADTLQHILATMILTLPRPPPPPPRRAHNHNRFLSGTTPRNISSSGSDIDLALTKRNSVHRIDQRREHSSLPPIPLLFGASFSSSLLFCALDTTTTAPCYSCLVPVV